MKFMVTWIIPDGEARRDMTAEQDQEMMGDSVTLIGRWHEVVSSAGVAIFESDSVAAVSNYLLNWNQVCDCDVTPVLDDEEARALGRSQS
jgi:hypothetical protein